MLVLGCIAAETNVWNNVLNNGRCSKYLTQQCCSELLLNARCVLVFVHMSLCVLKAKQCTACYIAFSLLNYTMCSSQLHFFVAR